MLLTLALCFCGQAIAAEGDPVIGAGTGFAIPEPGTYRLPVLKDAIDGQVLTPEGKTTTLFDVFDDKVVLLSFIYTQCGDGDGCPLAVTTFYAIDDMIAEDPVLRGKVRMVTLSFDPEHDTPQVMAEFAGLHGGDVQAATTAAEVGDISGVAAMAELIANLPGATPENVLCTVDPARLASAEVRDRWRFLTTASLGDLQPILDGYGQFVIPEIDTQGNKTGMFSHVLKVFLIDRRHEVRNIYSASFLDPDMAVADLKTVLMTGEGG